MAQAAQTNAFDASNSTIRVEHDKKRRQFVIRLNGSHDRAVLLYEYVGKKTVDLQHTEVPDAYRGRGIAKHLAKRWLCGKIPADQKFLNYPDQPIWHHDTFRVTYAFLPRSDAHFELQQAAMDFVVEEDLKAHLTCWYIQKYVKENPQPQYFEHIYQ